MPNWRMLSSHMVQVERATLANATGTGQTRATYAVVTGMSAVPCGIQPLSQTKILEALGMVFGESFTIAIDMDVLPSGQDLYGGDRLKDTSTGFTYTARQAQKYEGRLWVLYCEKKK